MGKNDKGLIFRPIKLTFESLFKGSNKVTTESPHIRSNINLKHFMLIAVVALLPSTFASIYYYGIRMLYLIGFTYLIAFLVEWAFAIFRKEDINEGILVTGLIFPLTLPPTIPFWIAGVGMAFGIFFGKEVFGGTGRNIFNPALVGRLFITIAFPTYMSSMWINPSSPDAVTSATPLIFLRANEALPFSLWDLMIGTAPGSIGETFRLGIIIAGLFLIVTRVIHWRVPVLYLGTVAVASYIGHLLIPSEVVQPMHQLLTGGLLFGAFFMATDPVSSPYTKAGQVIYGIGLGILTIVIRSFSGFAEGVMFAIILMNAFTPMIDAYIIDKKYKPLSE